MYKAIKAFLTAKIFITKGQVITQGMLYQLEKEKASLVASVGGLKAAFTRQEKKCAKCEVKEANAILEERLAGTIDISVKRDPIDNEIDSDKGVI
jgi:hypothetical protein